MKYQKKRPQIGMTCFVFDGTTWRRSDFLQHALTWKNNSISNLIYPDPVFPRIYRSSLLPQSKIKKVRCSFGHDFEGNEPQNGYVNIKVPSIDCISHSHFIEFNVQEERCIILDLPRQQQEKAFHSTILLQPSYVVS